MAENKRKKKKKAVLMAEYNIKPAGINPGETLEHAHKRLAKQADQRMRRLEQLSKNDNYKGVLTYAYGLAKKDIKSYYGEDGKRFDAAPPKNKRQLMAKINDMIRFLNSPTSTKGGIDKMYQKRTDTLNERFKTNFTWQEAGRFFADKKADAIGRGWDSGKVLKAIGKMQKKKDQIISELKESADEHAVISDEEVNNEIYRRLEENGIDAATLLDGKDPYGNDPFGKGKTKRRSTAKKRTKTSKKTKKSTKSRKSASTSKVPKIPAKKGVNKAAIDKNLQAASVILKRLSDTIE